MRARPALSAAAAHALAVLAMLAAHAPPARAATAATSATTAAAATPELLDEIQSHFHAAVKWFGMVADLQWERAADGSLTARPQGLTSKFVRAQDSAGQTLTARLPAFSTGAHEVRLDGVDGVSVRTEEIGIAKVAAEIHRGVIVYPGAVQGGDLLYKVTPTHLDEYVYFAKPPETLHREFEFDGGAGVARLRQAGRLIELYDRQGMARLRLSAPVARAADGTRRVGTVRLLGTRLIEELDLRGLAAPILVDPDWSTTGSMTVAHWADYGYRRPDGKVFAVGGCALASCPLGLATSSCNQILANTDAWDPASGTWTAGPPLLQGRYSYAGVVLPSGELLIAGGCTVTGCAATTATAERYSEASGAWVAAGALPSARANMTAALLPGGDAIAPGGCDEKQCFADVARYQASAGTWAKAGALSAPRGYATTTALADGTVLVIGGCADVACANVLFDAERYDPATDTWRSAGQLAKGRAGHTATLLADGTVLVTGGCSTQGCKGTALASTEIWAADPLKGGKFGAGPSMNAPRHHHTATRLANDQILLAGGTDGTDATRAAAEVYLPIGKRFYEAPRMMMSRAYHIAVGLSSGDVLVGGGCNPATCLPWAEVFSATGLPVELPDGGVADGGQGLDAGADASAEVGAPVTVTGGPHPKLFRTGAVSCGADDVQDLACPLAGWPAQDGDFQPNGRPMIPIGDTDVQDATTGLIWQAQDDAKTYSQADAVSACTKLSTSAPGAGVGAWRLPTVVELMTINHYGKIAPSIDQAFKQTQQTNYWTSTAVATSTMLGWTVKFDAGEVVPLLKDSALPIRCVRGEMTNAKAGNGHLRLAGPFSEKSKSALTVRDEANILEWQRDDDGKKRTWRDSLAYCASLELDGHHDWHLPNTYELLSLVEFASSDPVKIDKEFFPNAKGDLYWTGTFNEGIPTLSWSVTFNLGVVDGVTYSGQALARCVRHVQPAAPPAAASSCKCRIDRPADAAYDGAAVLATIALGASIRLRRRRRARGV